ncbi:MAG: BamA/TamA family outer membrane protein [Chitinophagales bacterium]
MKLLSVRTFVVLALLNLYCPLAHAQNETDTLSRIVPDSSRCPVEDLADVIRNGKPRKNEKPPKNHYIFLTPVIGSSPATGFIVGAAGQLSFKGIDPNDKYSVINSNLQLTTKNQVLFQIKNNLLLAHNKLFMSGDLRLFIYSQPTYGLGTDALNKDVDGGGIIIGNESIEADSVAQSMKYHYFKLHQLAAYNFNGIFYIGAGIKFDVYNKISVEYPLLNGADTSFHTEYSLLHGYDSTRYSLNGFSLNGIIDTRDNQINATRGMFMNLSFTYNPQYASANHPSAQKRSSIFEGELRYFKTFKVRHHDNTVALWVLGTWIAGGTAPYLTLPAIGWDQRSRSGRGYAQGTFRGESFLYGEFEYRFPITCNEVLGGVVFVNGTTTSDRSRNLPLFRYIQPAFGFGLRILIDKASRTNLVLDYGIGKKSSGFYLNAGETY